MKEDEAILKLSDAFEVPTEHPELELTVRILNINPGHNEALKDACTTLRQYMQFVEKVRKCISSIANRTSSSPLSYTERLNNAVAEAVDYCIAQDILGAFLKKHRSEVIAVTLYEYNEEEHRRIQEQDKSRLKKKLETTIEDFKTKLQQSESKLQQSESKHVQSILNTITVFRDMGVEDSLICSKLCEIYRITDEEAYSYVHDHSSTHI